MAVHVVHHPENQEFTVEEKGHSAELAYSLPAPHLIDFSHTYVDKPLRGQGIAEELARAGLEYARSQKLQILTSCAYMQQFVDGHPEYQGLRSSENR